MLVISDTTPIVSLLKVNALDLLEKLFGNVIIPPAVFTELTQNARYSSESEAIKNCDFIVTYEIENKTSVENLQKSTGLDLGESEAIVLFSEKKADLLLVDEKKGRKVADSLKILHIGTVGILLQAFKDSIISSDDVISYIDTMRKTGIRIDDKLMEIVKKRLQNQI